MTLPTSGPLSLSAIQSEFGGSNPISLSEYYAGGAYVTAGTSGTYGAVPSSGTISIRNFYGTSATPPFTPVTNTYNSGSGSETVPTGATSLTVYCVGAGNNGGSGFNGGDLDQYGGGGGGGGGTATKTVSISSGQWGSSISWAVGAANGGNSSVSGISISLAGNGGSNGTSASSGQVGIGGNGGSASGGDSNVTGDAGSNGDSFGNGGAGGTSSYGSSIGLGGDGGSAFSGGSNGTNGRVQFVWT